MLKASVLIALGLLCAGTALAEEGDIALLHAGTDINNIDSLQRGARNFMNDCSGCHSLKYLRYNRMATDLKIPESELADNLIFTEQGVRGNQHRHAGGFRGLVRQATARSDLDGAGARGRLLIFVSCMGFMPIRRALGA